MRHEVGGSTSQTENGSFQTNLASSRSENGGKQAKG